MRDRQRLILRVVLPVVLAGVLIVNPFGVRSKIGNMLLRSRADPDAVSEWAIDTDGNGQYDLWEVNIESFGPNQCSYKLKDRDHDGTPDELTVLTVRTECKMLDNDNDGEFDRLDVRIDHASDEDHSYRYHDLDLDGRFDIMVREYAGKPVATHLFMNETLAKAESFLTHDLKVAWIERAEGARQRAVFENGDWHIRL
jgi:hypothetical protein